jgi:hypothetical protein
LIREKLSSGEVLRFAQRKGLAPFPQRARIEDFLPTSREKDEAGKNDGHVLISVWDATTEFSQILSFRGIQIPDQPVFTLAVKEVTSIKVGDRARLYVVRDPLPEPDCYKPGADGHCGIGDLARRKGEPRAVIDDICSRLVDVARIKPYMPGSSS